MMIHSHSFGTLASYITDLPGVESEATRLFRRLADGDAATDVSGTLGNANDEDDSTRIVSREVPGPKSDVKHTPVPEDTVTTAGKGVQYEMPLYVNDGNVLTVGFDGVLSGGNALTGHATDSSVVDDETKECGAGGDESESPSVKHQEKVEMTGDVRRAEDSVTDETNADVDERRKTRQDGSLMEAELPVSRGEILVESPTDCSTLTGENELSGVVNDQTAARYIRPVLDSDTRVSRDTTQSLKEPVVCDGRTDGVSDSLELQVFSEAVVVDSKVRCMATCEGKPESKSVRDADAAISDGSSSRRMTDVYSQVPERDAAQKSIQTLECMVVCSDTIISEDETLEPTHNQNEIRRLRPEAAPPTSMACRTDQAAVSVGNQSEKERRYSDEPVGGCSKPYPYECRETSLPLRPLGSDSASERDLCDQRTDVGEKPRVVQEGNVEAQIMQRRAMGDDVINDVEKPRKMMSYQAPWKTHPERQWLDSSLRGEEPFQRRLVGEVAVGSAFEHNGSNYYSNVPGSHLPTKRDGTDNKCIDAGVACFNVECEAVRSDDPPLHAESDELERSSIPIEQCHTAVKASAIHEQDNENLHLSSSELSEIFRGEPYEEGKHIDSHFTSLECQNDSKTDSSGVPDPGLTEICGRPEVARNLSDFECRQDDEIPALKSLTLLETVTDCGFVSVERLDTVPTGQCLLSQDVPNKTSVLQHPIDRNNADDDEREVGKERGGDGIDNLPCNICEERAERRLGEKFKGTLEPNNTVASDTSDAANECKVLEVPLTDDVVKAKSSDADQGNADNMKEVESKTESVTNDTVSEIKHQKVSSRDSKMDARIGSNEDESCDSKMRDSMKVDGVKELSTADEPDRSQNAAAAAAGETRPQTSPVAVIADSLDRSRQPVLEIVPLPSLLVTSSHQESTDATTGSTTLPTDSSDFDRKLREDLPALESQVLREAVELTKDAMDGNTVSVECDSDETDSDADSLTADESLLSLTVPNNTSMLENLTDRKDAPEDEVKAAEERAGKSIGELLYDVLEARAEPELSVRFKDMMEPSETMDRDAIREGEVRGTPLSDKLGGIHLFGENLSCKMKPEKSESVLHSSHTQKLLQDDRKDANAGRTEDEVCEASANDGMTVSIHTADAIASSKRPQASPAAASDGNFNNICQPGLGVEAVGLSPRLTTSRDNQLVADAASHFYGFDDSAAGNGATIPVNCSSNLSESQLRTDGSDDDAESMNMEVPCYNSEHEALQSVQSTNQWLHVEPYKLERSLTPVAQCSAAATTHRVPMSHDEQHSENPALDSKNSEIVSIQNDGATHVDSPELQVPASDDKDSDIVSSESDGVTRAASDSKDSDIVSSAGNVVTRVDSSELQVLASDSKDSDIVSSENAVVTRAVLDSEDPNFVFSGNAVAIRVDSRELQVPASDSQDSDIVSSGGNIVTRVDSRELQVPASDSQDSDIVSSVNAVVTRAALVSKDGDFVFSGNAVAAGVDSPELQVPALDSKDSDIVSSVNDGVTRAALDCNDPDLASSENDIVTRVDSPDLQVPGLDSKDSDMVSSESAVVTCVDSPELQVPGLDSKDSDIESSESDGVTRAASDSKDSDIVSGESAVVTRVNSPELEVPASDSRDSDIVSSESDGVTRAALVSKDRDFVFSGNAVAVGVDSPELQVPALDDKDSDIVSSGGNVVTRVDSPDLQVPASDSKDSDILSSENAVFTRVDSPELQVRALDSKDSDIVSSVNDGVTRAALDSKDSDIVSSESDGVTRAALDCKDPDLASSENDILTRVDCPELQVPALDNKDSDIVSSESDGVTRAALDSKDPDFVCSESAVVTRLDSPELHIPRYFDVERESNRTTESFGAVCETLEVTTDFSGVACGLDNLLPFESFKSHDADDDDGLKDEEEGDKGTGKLLYEARKERMEGEPRGTFIQMLEPCSEIDSGSINEYKPHETLSSSNLSKVEAKKWIAGGVNFKVKPGKSEAVSRTSLPGVYLRGVESNADADASKDEICDSKARNRRPKTGISDLLNTDIADGQKSADVAEASDRRTLTSTTAVRDDSFDDSCQPVLEMEATGSVPMVLAVPSVHRPADVMTDTDGNDDVVADHFDIIPTFHCSGFPESPLLTDGGAAGSNSTVSSPKHIESISSFDIQLPFVSGSGDSAQLDPSSKPGQHLNLACPEAVMEVEHPWNGAINSVDEESCGGMGSVPSVAMTTSEEPQVTGAGCLALNPPAVCQCYSA
jgi:hypothetical protein